MNDGFIALDREWRLTYVNAEAERINGIRATPELFETAGLEAHLGRVFVAGDSAGGSNTAEPAYAARVSLDQTQMQVDGRLLDLSPGMTVSVEIKTGSRRIIGYLLSPLLRHTHHVARKR